MDEQAAGGHGLGSVGAVHANSAGRQAHQNETGRRPSGLGQAGGHVQGTICYTISPVFSADTESPASYRFLPTDDFLKSILATGSGVMYRLGESIEHTPRRYFVHKPADYDQWTKICLGIIRHYNEGWADGFHFNLRYVIEVN